MPEKVDIYLDFVNFWIRPLSFILQKMDRKRGLQYCAEYLNAINTCYQEASRMYKFRMSTTYRPPAALFGKFRMIHILDPHLLCVPSLHVAIVVLAYTFFADVFKQEHIPDDMQQKLSQELYAGALQIAETVLYVKQHSVNCIAAALYMMIKLSKIKSFIQLELKKELIHIYGDICIKMGKFLIKKKKKMENCQLNMFKIKSE